jgi:hypothetical protein
LHGGPRSPFDLSVSGYASRRYVTERRKEARHVYIGIGTLLVIIILIIIFA